MAIKIVSPTATKYKVKALSDLAVGDAFVVFAGVEGNVENNVEHGRVYVRGRFGDYVGPMCSGHVCVISLFEAAVTVFLPTLKVVPVDAVLTFAPHHFEV